MGLISYGRKQYSGDPCEPFVEAIPGASRGIIPWFTQASAPSLPGQDGVSLIVDQGVSYMSMASKEIHGWGLWSYSHILTLRGDERTFHRYFATFIHFSYWGLLTLQLARTIYPMYTKIWGHLHMFIWESFSLMILFAHQALSKRTGCSGPDCKSVRVLKYGQNWTHSTPLHFIFSTWLQAVFLVRSDSNFRKFLSRVLILSSSGIYST